MDDESADMADEGWLQPSVSWSWGKGERGMTRSMETIPNPGLVVERGRGRDDFRVNAV
jgi:hypothetical protein